MLKSKFLFKKQLILFLFPMKNYLFFHQMILVLKNQLSVLVIFHMKQTKQNQVHFQTFLKTQINGILFGIVFLLFMIKSKLNHLLKLHVTLNAAMSFALLSCCSPVLQEVKTLFPKERLNSSFVVSLL